MLWEDLGGIVDVNNDIMVKFLLENFCFYVMVIICENGVFCGKCWVEEVFI